jgi:EAL domain-containing protein (putative c-di-GMP-specific phosphodiesterase class I)
MKGVYLVPDRDVVRCRYCRTLWPEAGHEVDDERSLRRAIERDELTLRYQPVVVLPEGQVIGTEALVRWCHPVRGLLAPDDFVPLAEETGLVVPMGTWVVRAACRQAAEWHRSFPDRSLFVSVNVATEQLDLQFPAAVADALAAADLPPHLLWLEITKSGLIEDFASLRPCLEELKGLGVKLALDDFGTGYSSLSDVTNLPVDILKMDRGLVDEIGDNPRTATLVASIFDMAHALDLVAMTAGVETRQQLTELLRHGCDLAQGHLWSPPLPANEVTAILRRGVPLTDPAAVLLTA